MKNIEQTVAKYTRKIDPPVICKYAHNGAIVGVEVIESIVDENFLWKNTVILPDGSTLEVMNCALLFE